MLTRFQKASIITLAALFFVNTAVLQLLFSIETFQQRAERESSENKKLITLHLSHSEFSKLSWRGKKDFLLHDEMYDAESITSTKDGVVIICHKDDREKKLFDRISLSMNQDKKQRSSGETKSVYKLMPLFFGEANHSALFSEPGSGFSKVTLQFSTHKGFAAPGIRPPALSC